MGLEVRRLFYRVSKVIMKSHRVHVLNPHHHDNPIRIRPWFVLFTTITMLSLGVLGFTNFHEALPLSDKLARFICFWVATFVFYFIVDVDEHARRVWLWRNSGMILTIFTCLFCGGILSEVVQSLLPFKEFEFGDVAANLVGSTIGLYTAFHLERYYRHRREIARLYRPLDTDEPISDDDDDDELVLSGTQLLPLYGTVNSEPGATVGAGQPIGSSKGSKEQNVWDEREGLFEDDRDEG